MEARTELVLVNGGTITADWYIRDILAPHVIPFAQFIEKNCMLMQDNARPHTAGIVTEYLDDVKIQKMDWPSRSPDFNPIVHVWVMMGRKIRNRVPAPSNLEQ